MLFHIGKHFTSLLANFNRTTNLTLVGKNYGTRFCVIPSVKRSHHRYYNIIWEFDSLAIQTHNIFLKQPVLPPPPTICTQEVTSAFELLCNISWCMFTRSRCARLRQPRGKKHRKGFSPQRHHMGTESLLSADMRFLTDSAMFYLTGQTSVLHQKWTLDSCCHLKRSNKFNLETVRRLCQLSSISLFWGSDALLISKSNS